MSEQIWLTLGPVGAIMAILIVAVQKVLKNQSDATNKQLQMQADFNGLIVERMDRVVAGIPEGTARIEGAIVNQISASEGRILGGINSLSSQLQRHSETCATHLAKSVAHNDAKVRHEDAATAHIDAVEAKTDEIVAVGRPKIGRGTK